MGRSSARRWKSLAVGLSPWVIQDGNYGEFQRGTGVEFALQYSIRTAWEPAFSEPLTFSRFSDNVYNVTARLLHHFDRCAVIDIGGLLVYADGEHSGVIRSSPDETRQLYAAGSTLRGRIALDVDDFSYFERLYALPGMPAMIYRWSLQKIELLIAPKVPGSDRNFDVDMSHWPRREIDQTDAWHEGIDDEYLLTIRLLDPQPMYRSRTAVYP